MDICFPKSPGMSLEEGVFPDEAISELMFEIATPLTRSAPTVKSSAARKDSWRYF
jgi:hypothetical protein